MRKTKLLDLIPFSGCAHEFSWPRRWDDGEYYQVCLLCGAEYRYDWKTMRRAERLPAEPGGKRHFPVTEKRKPTWSPRARRLKVEIELKYRARGSSQWQTGTIQNISQSGVLFHSAQTISGDEVEMIFVMPKEIAGQEGRSVLCSGNVVRASAMRDSEGSFSHAVSIRYYKFLHRERERSHSAD